MFIGDLDAKRWFGLHYVAEPDSASEVNSAR
jgi:hypothetical protein